MPVDLFVANLPSSVTEAEVHDLLAQFGTVNEVRRLLNQRTNEFREAMFVQLDEDDVAPSVLNALNGYIFIDRPIFVTMLRPPKGPLSDEEKETIQYIIEQLEEVEDTPKRQIQQIVHLGGIPFARALLDETGVVESAGGLLIMDGTRQRTRGGVFFRLARLYLPNRLQKAIFYIPVLDPEAKKAAKAEKAAAKKAAKEAKEAKAAGQQPKKKDGGKAKQQPQKPAFTLPPLQADFALPVGELTDEIRQQYADLKESHQQAQQRLAAIQAQPPAKQAGLFSATKELWQIESQLKTLQRDYPELT